MKKTKFEKLTSIFTFSPFKRHSFTFIRLSEVDKTGKVYREERTFMLGQGEEEAGTEVKKKQWQQQLVVGDRRRVCGWRMTVQVINIVFFFLYRPNFNFRPECPIFAGTAGIVRYLKRCDTSMFLYRLSDR